MEKIFLALNYEQALAKQSETEFYNYPDLTTKYFKKNYSKPIIYRWNIYKEVLGDLKTFYIGETDLLSRRVNQYRKPGPTQKTNKDLNAKFEDYIKKGNRITLEVIHLKVSKESVPSLTIDDLKNKDLRKALEGLLIYNYREKNYILLNK